MHRKYPESCCTARWATKHSAAVSSSGSAFLTWENTASLHQRHRVGDIDRISSNSPASRRRLISGDLVLDGAARREIVKRVLVGHLPRRPVRLEEPSLRGCGAIDGIGGILWSGRWTGADFDFIRSPLDRPYSGCTAHWRPEPPPPDPLPAARDSRRLATATHS